MQRIYYPLFLMHRYFFIVIIFTAGYFGPVQAFLMIIITSFLLYYLVLWKPFVSKVDLALHILNTFILILLYLFCLLFSIFSPKSSEKLRTTLGLIFIFTVLALFVINFLTIIIFKIVGLVVSCKKHKEKQLHQDRLKT